MLNGALARRYAQALFELAVEMSVLDRVDEELTFIVEVISKNEDLKYLLNHPHIDPEIKQETVDKIFGTDMSEMTKHFLYLLIDRHRQNLLALIQRQFNKLANQVRNLIEVQAVTAFKLSSVQEEKIKDIIAKCTGKNVLLLTEVDPKLIGGAKLRIGDKMLDGSIATALSRMREELIKSSLKPQQEVGVS